MDERNVVELRARTGYEAPHVRDLGEMSEISIVRAEKARKVVLEDLVTDVTGA